MAQEASTSAPFNNITNRSNIYPNNKKPLRAKKKPQQQQNYDEIRFAENKPIEDDKQGHLICHWGEVLKDQFAVHETLGQGTFGKVMHVEDLISKKHFALKIIKTGTQFKENAKIEVNVLKQVSVIDPQAKCFVEFVSWFEYHTHTCIAFEKLGLSIFEFMRNNNNQPFSLLQVRHIAFQLCYSMQLLHDHKLTHTDLKPENILFIDSDFEIRKDKKLEYKAVTKTDIKIIDFGGATFDSDHHTKLIQTRSYRAPEVILQLGWSQPCDVWSVGCILFELYLGKILFKAYTDIEHLALMEHILGKLPDVMVEKTLTNFYKNGQLNWDDESTQAQNMKRRYKTFEKYMRKCSGEVRKLYDLIYKMLTYEPTKRISFEAALKHQFFETISIEKDFLRYRDLSHG